MMRSPTDDPTLKQTSKALTQTKQTVSIRKVTIESLSPVIAKLEEHIAFLIEETTKLRKQNNNLITAQANQKVLEEQVGTINQTIAKMNKNIDKISSDKQAKIAAHQEQLQIVFQRLDKMNKTANQQSKKVTQINNKNESYLQQISQTKHEQSQLIQSLREHLDNYYEQELSKINLISDSNDNLKSMINVMNQERANDQEEIRKINNVVALYQSQREEYRKNIEKTTFLELNAVMLQDYQRYKKYNRIQMDLTKADIQHMIDEALTPQIRRFLPVLIAKLSELNSFESKLETLYTTLESNHLEARDSLSTVQAQLNQKLTQMNTLNAESSKEIKNIIKDEVCRLEEQEKDIKERIQQIGEEVGENRSKAKDELAQTIKKMQLQQKEYIEKWGQQLVDSKKHQIYKVVQSLKPKLQINQQKQIYNIVYTMQPLLKQVREQLQISTDQLQKAMTSINDRLSLFNNQIVKFKTDVTRQSSQSKKTMQSFTKKLKLYDTFNTSASSIISKILQCQLLSYCLNLDQTYLKMSSDRQKQIYVTFNDGILLEVLPENRHMIKYRRKVIDAEMAKRAVLKEFVKLIDQVAMKMPEMHWENNQMKPSHHFNNIYKTYTVLCQQNRQYLQSRKNTPLSYNATNQKQSPSHSPYLSSKNSRFSSPKNAKNTLEPVSSKALDLSNSQFTTIVQTSRYERDARKSNRKSVRLKKIEKKESKQIFYD